LIKIEFAEQEMKQEIVKTETKSSLFR